MSNQTPIDPRAILAAILAMFGWAASGVISKGIAEIGPLAVVFWRMWIYTAIIVAFLHWRGTPLRLSSMKVSLKGGLALGADLMLFFVAIRMTTVANATVIGACLPVLMLLFSGPIFGEKPRRQDWMIALVALGGVAIVTFGSSGLPEWSPMGDFLSVLTLIAWTLYFVFSRLAQREVSSSQYTGSTAVIAAIVTTPFAIASGQVFVMPSPNAWFWLVILAIGPGFTSHMLMNWSLGRTPTAFASTLTLGIPVFATLMAWAFLGEAIVPMQLVGMAIVIVTLGYLVTTTRAGAR